MLLLTEATLFFLNLQPSSSTKSSLVGRVKNWAALVEKPTTSSKKPLHADLPTTPQPANTVSHMTGLKTLTVSDIAGPPPTENISSTLQTEYTLVDDDTVPEDLVGGFGDDNLDDEVEREAALLNKKQSICHLFEKVAHHVLIVHDASHRTPS